ncbi:MAG: hypothetical protein KME10_11725 [Plectolyngbya sp. WJT66-NPBG17]|jgi:hypothetical protein|nr:hypothetical protein [Plectolyngbya sp. WJT66-NPBG17]
MTTKPPGYYTESPEAQSLAKRFGDYFEALTANEKLGLTAALTLWLSIDDAGDAHWTIPAIAHTQLFPSSQNLSHAVSIVEEIAPDDALNLLAALIEQLRNGVFAA